MAEAQALEIVSYLLDAGAKVDERDARGRAALMIAAEGNHPAIAKALLAHGADARAGRQRPASTPPISPSVGGAARRADAALTRLTNQDTHS